MAEAVETIKEVETKTLPTGTVIYVIKDGQGREYSTKDRDIAQEAYGAVGQIAHFDYTEKKGGQFGQFTNRYLNQFALIPDDGSPGRPLHGEAAPSGLFNDTEPEPLNFPPPSEAMVGRDREAEKQLNINMATCLIQAVATLPNLPESERSAPNVLTIADFYMRNWFLGWKP